MADAVTATTVQDGDRNAVIYCTNTSDGTGEAAVTKVDVSALASRKTGRLVQVFVSRRSCFPMSAWVLKFFGTHRPTLLQRNFQQITPTRWIILI